MWMSGPSERVGQQDPSACNLVGCMFKHGLMAIRLPIDATCTEMADPWEPVEHAEDQRLDDSANDVTCGIMMALCQICRTGSKDSWQDWHSEAVASWRAVLP